jgi:hypothetical protein
MGILIMPPVSAVENVVWLVSSAVQLILIGKLRITGLAIVYRWFFRYLCVQLPVTLLLISLDPRTNLFGFVWIPAQVVLGLLYYLVVYEIYSLVLDDYPGIQRWGKRIMQVGMAVCILVAGASVLIDLSNSGPQFPVLLAVNIFRRGVALSLVLFIGLMMAYLAYFPVPLKSNVAVHAGLTGAYLLTVAVGVFHRNLAGPDFARTFSVLLGAITATVVTGWVSLLNPTGERRQKTTGFKWNPGGESQLLEQLQSINASLLASTRKY